MTFPPPPPRGQLLCRSKQGTWLGRGRGGCWQLPGIRGDGTGPACSEQDGGRSRGWGHCLVPVVPVLGSCCALICLFLPQASVGWPGAMRCSPKRCLTAALTAFVLLLLFLLLHRGSWQEQEPLEVSPAPVSSHWRGELGCPPVHIPCLPAPYGSSRLVLFPPLSRGIPSSASLMLLCTLGAAPGQDLGGQDLGALPCPLLPPPRVREAVSTPGSELTSCGSHPGGV